MLEKTSKINWPSTDNLTEYDIHSIMHYDGTLRGHFAKPIMTDKITGKGIAINREMSPLDIKKLNKMYPCKSKDVCGKFFHKVFRISFFRYRILMFKLIYLTELRYTFISSNAGRNKTFE